MILWNHIPLFYYRDSTKIGNGKHFPPWIPKRRMKLIILLSVILNINSTRRNLYSHIPITRNMRKISIPSFQLREIKEYKLHLIFQEPEVLLY